MPHSEHGAGWYHNCFFHCILDQLNHANGAGHDFTHHQLTNHIRRHGNKFKNFFLLGNNLEDITGNYIHKMGQNSTWGGHPEVNAAAWFYDIDITIYSPEYTNTCGFLVFKAGGPKGTFNTPNAMWNISYHSNNHFNSIQSPKNPPCPSQGKMWIVTKPTCRLHWTTTKMILPSLLFCPILMAPPFLPTTLTQFEQPPA